MEDMGVTKTYVHFRAYSLARYRKSNTNYNTRRPDKTFFLKNPLFSLADHCLINITVGYSKKHPSFLPFLKSQVGYRYRTSTNAQLALNKGKMRNDSYPKPSPQRSDVGIARPGEELVFPSSTWGFWKVELSLWSDHRSHGSCWANSTRRLTSGYLMVEAMRLFALVDLDDLDVEDEGGAARDVWGSATGTVGVVGGDGDPALGANGHAGDTDVPALDDLAATELEGERLALLVAVEDLVVLLELSDVAHANTVAVLGGGTGAGLLVVDGDAVNDTGTGGSLGLLSGGRGGLGGGRALLEVLGELDLLVGLGGRRGLGLGLGNNGGGAVVLLHLLELLLAELLGGLGLGLGDHGVERLVGGGALVLALLGLDKLGCLLLILNLGDAGVLHVVEVVLGVVLILLGIVLVVGLALAVLVVMRRLDVVAGKENAVGTRDLEVDALVLTDGDVQGLLEVLRGMLV
jgi:hypothetical protein